MTNIIREDVVQVSVDVDLQELNKLMKELNELKKKLSGGIGDDTFDGMGNSANDAADDIDKLTKENKELKEELDKVKNSVGGVNDKLTTLAKKGATLAFNGLKKLAGISFKALTAGIAAAATAVGFLIKSSVAAYAEYEQLFGGMQTLLGAKGATNVEEYAKLVGKSVSEVKDEYADLAKSEKLVMENANNAFKTAGMSANTYMETVTSFSAALKNSLGGDTLEAAKLADVAIQDMADNANKMGTPLENVQTVYSNLARGMYMTLDNLKLGYAGTKEGAMEMVNDAAKIDKSVKANDLSYANLVKAIHAVQVKMDIYGTTSKEAFGTITGSLNTFKAAWGNLLPAMVKGGDELDVCINNLVDSIVGFKDESGELKGGIINNLMPAIEKSLSGLGTLIERLSPTLEKELPKLIDTLLPPLIKAATALLKGLIIALPDIAKVIIQEIPDILKSVSEAIAEAFGLDLSWLNKLGDFFEKNGAKIAKFIPVIAALVGAFMLFNKLKGVGSLFSGLFGKGGGSGGEGGKGGLFSGLANLAKIKTTSVLKGMVNLGIILGGFAILIPLLMFIVPLIDALGGVTAFLKIALVMGAMGILGGVLGQFAGIVGKIPVSTVVKGLANMAIVIAGVTALVLLLGAATLINFDYKRIVALIGIIGLLGTLGTVLSVFAGIVGLIPIPVVLMGLANIALVLGGLTALILAYGALAQVDGIQEFVAVGGDLLAQLFGVLGKIVGSIIGGVGEGISEALPAIGTNIAKFAENIKPMFTAFQGVDMGGVGSFFGSLGGFLLTLTANDILSWFTGGTDLAQLGTDLNDFATNAEGFFTKIATYPENSFTNATKLFEALSGLGGLPNSGGVVGWFCGEINYTDIASGLEAFAGEGVAKFFTMVSKIAPETFDKTTQLFESLSGLGGLPNSGGVAGWFSGDINYSDIAEGLTSLGGEGVKNFFLMAESLTPKAFENTKLLFESLSGMADSLPKEDNWWDKLWGTESVSLGDVAADLGTFAENSKSFFALVKDLNLTNLNGLWESLKNASGLTADISTKVGENIDDMVAKIEKLPKKMGDALKNSGKPLADSFVEVWKEAVKASVKPVNKLLSGANHILKEFGSKKTVIEWQPYAKGTNGHKGGNALVNDGGGAELVQMPNGNTFIPRGRNVFIPNAPKGMKVLPANQTAQLMGRSSPTFNYADGIGNIDIWSYYDNAEGLVDKIVESISYKGMSGFASSLGQGMVTTFAGEMPAWIDKLFEECGQSISSYNASKGARQWLPTVVRALKMEGQYSLLNVARTLFQMQTESGGNPRAINLWDSNAKKGIPSKGLMQVIDPTFNAYARDGFDKNIYDPLSNILASIRYAVSRYGSLARAYRGVGYENGGLVTQTGTIAENPLYPEWVIPTDPHKRGHALNLWTSAGEMLGISYSPESDGDSYTSNSVEYNTYSPVFEAHFHGVTDERTLKRNVKKWFAESFEEMAEEMERSNA